MASGGFPKGIALQKGQNPREVLGGRHRERGPKRYHYTIHDVLRVLGWQRRKLERVLKERDLQISNFEHVMTLCAEVVLDRTLRHTIAVGPDAVPQPRPRSADAVIPSDDLPDDENDVIGLDEDDDIELGMD